MGPYEVVKAIMITFTAVYILLEVVLNLNDIDDDTSNILLLEWSKGKFFIIPFALGAIGGHLFAGTKNPLFEMGSSMYPVFILFAVAAISVYIGHKIQFKKTKFFLSALLLLGVLYGHYLWSMNYEG
jgi:hypothetical protein